MTTRDAPPALLPRRVALPLRDLTGSALPKRRRPRRPALVRDAVLCLGAYLYGSLPLVYLFGARRNVNLKRVGSGNVGATNLLPASGPVFAVAGWVFDASKGLLPVLICRRAGYSEGVARLAGALGVAGQCWPAFLRFSGGRGISAFVGAAAAMNPVAWGPTLLPMIVGGLWRVVPRHTSGIQQGRKAARSKSVPFGCFVAALVFPLLCALTDRRRAAGPLVAAGLLPLVIYARRLTAAQPDDASVGPRVRRRALWYRLLYDRNTSQ